LMAEELQPVSNAIFGPVPLCFLARIYTLIGEYELALVKLEKITGMPQDEWSTITLQMDPLMAPLRDHPRFHSLIKKHEMKGGP